jgi:hypothetical protein
MEEMDMKPLRLVLCALLLAPFAAVAQEEEPAEVVEEVPAEEAAPAGEAPAEEGAAAEAPAEATPQETAAAEPAEEEPEEPEEPLVGSHVDAYYIPTTALSMRTPGTLDATERGDGMGGRGMYRVFKWLAVTGEYGWRRLEDIDDELTETSAGVGATVHNGSNDLGGIFLEYDKFDADFIELDGFSLHARLMRQPSDWFSFTGDIGFLKLEDDAEDHEGVEYTIGLGFGSSTVKLFADWHYVRLEGKSSGTRTQVGDARVGARLSF